MAVTAESQHHPPNAQQVPQSPPPGGYPPPPKKTHKFRNFVVFPFLGLIALIVIMAAAGGGGDSTNPNTATGGEATGTATTKPSAQPSTTEQSEPEDRNAPRVVTPGKAFVLGNHRLNTGWKLTYQEYLGTQLVGSLTNVGDDTSTAFFHVKFLKGSTVLANFQCASDDLEVGQAEQIECYNSVTSTKRLTGWDKVTAEADF
ncbi:hypothetical protein ACXC9Q_19110 [Kribbella sp. CWNU-51]